MTVRRPVLRYHGGKWKLAPWIVEHMPAHRIYVEPFGGGGSVLMRKPRSYAEVYNDRWSVVVDVFQVLRDPELAQQLERALTLTPFARDEFDKTGRIHVESIKDPVERARRTIFRSLAGFGSASINGDHATGFRSNSNRSGTTPAHDWMSYPPLIASFVERLRGVVIENREAADVIRQHDTPETLFYVDPPYILDTRNTRRGNAAYACDMTDDQHRDLAAVLREVQGMVMISGYPHPLYDEELFPDWRRIERDAYSDGARPRTEAIWFNERAWQTLQQHRNVSVHPLMWADNNETETAA